MITLDALALVVAGAGIVVWLLAASRLHHPLAGVPAMLDLWTAAGLLRLSGSPTWQRIAAAAALIAVRKLVTEGLGRAGPRATAPSGVARPA